MNAIDPENNPLGPRNLTGIFFEMANDFVLAEIYADVLISQNPVKASNVDDALAVSIKDMQDKMKNHADYFINSLMDYYIKVNSDAFNMAAVARATIDTEQEAIRSSFDNAKARKSASQGFLTLADEVRRVGSDTQTLANHFDIEQRILKDLNAGYTDALSTLISTLSGTDGLISAKLAQIDTLKAEIEQDIEDVVKGGSEIGGAVTELVTGILTSIGSAEPDKKPGGNDGNGEGDDSGNDDEDETSENDAESGKNNGGEIDTAFAVHAIGAAREGASKMSAALSGIRSNNVALATAYQELARDQMLLTVAKVVEAQTAMFVKAMKKAVNSTHELSTALGRVASSVEDFATEISKADAHSSAPASLSSTARAADGEWQRLATELTSIKRSIIFQSGLPDVGPFSN